MQRVTIQGPLPAPHLLRQYEEIHPGFTNRLLTVVEEEGKHRRSLDQPTLEANFKLARSGQLIAGIVCLASLASGTYLVANGNTPVGVAVMFLAIGSIVAPLFGFRRPKPPPPQDQPQG